MTGSLLELARTRFLAAAQGWFLVVTGPRLWVVERGDTFLVKTGGMTLAPATPAPWTDVLALVFEVEQVVGGAMRGWIYVPLANVGGLKIQD